MDDLVKFEGKRMPGAVFHKCGLAGASFDDVNLGEARFHNVNLKGASFDDVNLSNVRIDNANIEGLTIYGIDIHDLVDAEMARREGRKPEPRNRG